MSTDAASEGQIIPTWSLGDRLRKIRRMIGLSQAQLAEQLGTNSKTYASWELDGSAPRNLVAVAKRIEVMSGVPASWLLGLDGEPGFRSVIAARRSASRRLATPSADNIVHVPFPFTYGDAAVPGRAA